MSTTGLADLIEQLPPGRARTRYEHMLAEEGEMLSVAVSYCDQSLRLVTSQSQARRLMGQGISRWRIWTLDELQDFFGPVTLMKASQLLTEAD